MATISASYTFDDGDSVGACVEIENDYPDALSQAVATCVQLLREVMVTGIVVQDDDGGD